MKDPDSEASQVESSPDSTPTINKPPMTPAKSHETQTNVTLNKDHQHQEIIPQIVIQQQPVSSRDWVQIIVTALPGIAALIALIFTYASLNGQLQANSNQLQATKDQLQATKDQISIESQGQITDRFNAAVTNLGSSAIDVRVGGIYALQRIMVDSHRDQPAILEILTAFVRDRSPAAARRITGNGPLTVPSALVSVLQGKVTHISYIPADIQAALTVIGNRNAAFDKSAVIDLSHSNLNGADLSGLNFKRTAFFGSDLIGSTLTRAQLDETDFQNADLFAASLSGSKLVGAWFNAANLEKAILTEANLSYATFGKMNYSSLEFSGADLSKADLTGANVKGTFFKGANLSGVIGLRS